jgi:hypothetical protein
MSGYDTNLASEFHVLSILHRLGAEAMMTLGNKKSVDIVVVRKKGEAVTVDVKGVARKYDWPADNIRPTRRNRHFVVLVSFESKISKPAVPPSVWVVPYESLKDFTKQYKGRKNILRARILKSGKRYKNAWGLILRST